ncbi:Tyrosine-protein phosphatase [Apiospora saccharicola]|uniref:Tyrosine-protein phosphatase n=1 Tax=Apiospora saccharicola TaxID=335842 RepID=A0ABR1V9H0_9PEZI
MAASTSEELPFPFINVPGLPNFRDLGGVPYPIPTQPGKTIKRGLIFRSSEPSKVTTDGIQQLRDLGIKKVYDLRSLDEIKKDAEGGERQVKEWEGAERVFVPVWRDQDFSPGALALRFKQYSDESERGFLEAYKNILLAASSNDKPYEKILAHLTSSDDPAPILMHCTAGKDRTGVLCALILSLCGVDDEAVVAEYHLTDTGLKSRHQELMDFLMRDPSLAGNRAGAWRMISANPRNMQVHLNWIRENYGSVEKCVVDLGIITTEGIAQLKRNLIVDETTHSS